VVHPGFCSGHGHSAGEKLDLLLRRRLVAYLANKGADKVMQSQWAPPDDEIDQVDRIM
jgi:hypothetical protein